LPPCAASPPASRAGPAAAAPCPLTSYAAQRCACCAGWRPGPGGVTERHTGTRHMVAQVLIMTRRLSQVFCDRYGAGDVACASDPAAVVAHSKHDSSCRGPSTHTAIG
jgi:hypothetical protein